MVRAVFEGVALNSAWLLGAVEKYCKKRFDSLAFVGGGANSDLWAQIHADAMGAPSARSPTRCWPTCAARGSSWCSWRSDTSRVVDIPGTVAGQGHL
jgi:xylulokinase